MCTLLSLTATPHCLQEKKKKTNKAAAGNKKEGKAEPKEEVKKQAPQSKAEGKKAPEAKKVEATVVPPPWMGMATQSTQRRARSPSSRSRPQGRANAANAIDVGILHVKYRILCRILNTMKNTVFFRVFCADSARYS